MSGAEMVMDLGTSVTRVAFRRGGKVVDAPTVAATDLATSRLLAFGREALAMQGRAAGRVAIVRPMVHGQFTDLDLAEEFLAGILAAAGASWRHRPSVLACVPGGSTGVQRRAVVRGLRRGGAREVALLDHQTAAAIGARLPIHDASGSMVVDMGAGTTEIGILALGATAASTTVPVGGADLDEAIRAHCRRQLDLVVDPATAEQVKRAIGSAWGLSEEANAEVRGRDLASGEPRTVVISRSELLDVMDEHLREIVARLVGAICSAPPDLGNDLLARGVYLAGGSARLLGLRERIEAETGLSVHVVDQPELCTISGALRCTPPPAVRRIKRRRRAGPRRLGAPASRGR
jgi:rod shape-determining protein MreB and related proteins